MPAPWELVCFAACYALALALELVQLFRPRPIQRLASLILGGVGLLAHLAYVVLQPLPLDQAAGSLLFLALILAIFYLYGSIHHGRLAWGLFVLPLVLGLIALAVLVPRGTPGESEGLWAMITSLRGERFWTAVHGLFFLLAAVGVCVGGIASVMYLVQAQRLKSKRSPSQGIRMFSLERIEDMNRRAILLAFPLLTAGLLVGIALQLQRGPLFASWNSPKIL